MADFSTPGTISVSCPLQLAPFLEKELLDLGMTPINIRSTGMDVKGSLKDCIRLCLGLRTAHRVHFLLEETKIDTPDQLYGWLKKISWEDYIDANGYLSVTSRVDHPSISNTQFANLRVKDAVTDRIRSKKGRRPDSGPDLSKTVLFLYWDKDIARVYLDTTGESLSRRGYRRQQGPAPMQESLAAALVMQTGWPELMKKPGAVFVNPMCGSGTLAIEAALFAKGLEPGALRKNYGFMHITGYERTFYREIRKENLKKRETENIITPVIIAADHDKNAIDAAMENAEAASVRDMIQFELCDVADTPVPDGEGAVLINPPYGKRIGETEALKDLYQKTGDFLKNSCAGKTGFVITGNPELGQKIGLKASSKKMFFNSTIECRLLEYELYEGSKKEG